MSLSNTSHWMNQNEVKLYLSELRKYPPITVEQEKAICDRIKNGDVNAKNELIVANLRFVVTAIKKYQNQGLSLSDLIAEGNYGLIKASERYNYQEQPVRFLSYAVWWIKQTILDSLQKNSRIIRLPANLIEEVSKSNKEPLADTSHDYTLQCPRIISLDYNVDDDGNNLHDLLNDDTQKSPDATLNNPTHNIKSSLKKMMSFLNKKEQFVLIKSFGLDEEEPWTLQDIADNMDLTKERVRQILEKTLKKLKSNSHALFELIN